MVLSWYSTTTIYFNVSTNSLPWKNGLFHQTSVKNGCLEFQVVPKFLKKSACISNSEWFCFNEVPMMLLEVEELPDEQLSSEKAAWLRWFRLHG